METVNGVIEREARGLIRRWKRVGEREDKKAEVARAALAQAKELAMRARLRRAADRRTDL